MNLLGKRNDLNKIKSYLDEGKSLEFIADEHFSQWCQYRRAFREYQALKSTPRSWKTTIQVYWGRTGTGKTRKSHELCLSEPWTPGDFQWFDGYSNHEYVIIDDYRGEYPLQMLLKLLDRYPMQVPVKGGFVNWAPRKVFITSNLDPKSWYPVADYLSQQALLRRLENIDRVEEPLFEDIEIN